MLFNQERKLKDSIGLDARVILTVNDDILGCLDTIYLSLVDKQLVLHLVWIRGFITSPYLPDTRRTMWETNSSLRGVYVSNNEI